MRNVSFVKYNPVTGAYEVSHFTDGKCIFDETYIEHEHALFNAVSFYLYIGKQVRVYVNPTMHTVIEELPENVKESAC